MHSQRLCLCKREIGATQALRSLAVQLEILRRQKESER
jgi:hypothetical protein